MARDSVTCITLERIACSPDQVPRVYRALAAPKGNHGGPKFEDCGVEATLRRPVVIQERDCCYHGTKRNDNPIKIVELKVECYLRK